MTNKLHKISGTDNPSRFGDVIFVHGLGGDPITTWHPKESDEIENSWLDWLGLDIEPIGIWSVSYSAAPFKNQGDSMPLVDIATNIVDLLNDYRIGDRPIIFIAHSMGGLVVKQILRHANDFGNESWGRILSSTKGIIYLSTPHTGSNLATYARHIGNIFRTTVNVEELEAHHSRLRELNEVYRNHEKLKQIPIKVFCESLPTKFLKPLNFSRIVVDKDSANPGISGVTPIPLRKDHVDIAKPISKDDRPYLSVKNFIEDKLEIASKTEFGTLLAPLESNVLNAETQIQTIDVKKKM